MATPFFSIIIPTYNSGKTLSKCLDSIMNQTFKNYEVVIVDGVSTDDTMSIVKLYVKIFSNIRCVSEKDTGTYNAMNKGGVMAKGKWIYFLGSDDRLFEFGTLENLFQIVEQSDLDMVYGNVLIEGDSIWANDKQIYNGSYSLDKLLISNICHQAIFYKREEFIKIGGYNTKYHICADWDLNFKFFAKKKILYTDQVIAFFASSGKSSKKVYDQFLDNDIVINLRAYFGWSLFNSNFFIWRHLLIKNANVYFKKCHFLKGCTYLAAYNYHNWKKK